jgi:hypothetical protein
MVETKVTASLSGFELSCATFVSLSPFFEFLSLLDLHSDAKWPYLSQLKHLTFFLSKFFFPWFLENDSALSSFFEPPSLDF